MFLLILKQGFTKRFKLATILTPRRALHPAPVRCISQVRAMPLFGKGKKGIVFTGGLGMDNLHEQAGLFSGGSVLGKSKYGITRSGN